MNDSKILRQFIEAQYGAMHDMSSKAPGHTKTSKKLVNPKTRSMVEMSGEEGFDYICSKKPPQTKVRKFLQSMIDQIAEENDL